MEAAIASQRKQEASVEEARQRQSERTDAFNVVQGRFYKVGSEIARLEQSIEHAHELRERQTRDLEQARQGAAEILDHIDKDQTEIAQLELTLNELVPGLEQARQSEAASAESLRGAEAALADWQEQWDDYSTRFNEAEQLRNVEQTRSEQIESRIVSFSERRKKLDESTSGESIEELKSAFDELTAAEMRQRQARDEFDRHLADIAEKIRKLREQDQKLTRLVEERRSLLNTAQGRFASVDALQKAALGESDGDVHTWLVGEGLEDNKRVAQTIDVAAGWERAVETVLGDYLQAVCVDDLSVLTEKIASFKSGEVTFLDATPGQAGLAMSSDSLASKVTSAPAALEGVLSNVIVADGLGAALATRANLRGGQSVITPDGVWLGRDWLRVSKDKDAKAGVLAREHEMRRLKSDIRELQARFDSSRKLLQDGRNRQTQLEERREALQQDAASLMNGILRDQGRTGCSEIPSGPGRCAEDRNCRRGG